MTHDGDASTLRAVLVGVHRARFAGVQAAVAAAELAVAAAVAFGCCRPGAPGVAHKRGPCSSVSIGMGAGAAWAMHAWLQG